MRSWYLLGQEEFLSFEEKLDFMYISLQFKSLPMQLNSCDFPNVIDHKLDLQKEKKGKTSLIYQRIMTQLSIKQYFPLIKYIKNNFEENPIIWQNILT